jgi:hypothetical protein
MKEKKLLTLGIAALFFGMILAFAVPVAAQHVGGLGEKKIPLNIATVEQLLKIREKSGFFNAPEDLLKVPGMTQETYKELDPKMGTEGDIYCVPAETEGEEEEDEDVPLAPSKC